MVVKIDTWYKPSSSWVKLLDINAKHKFWIYLCKDEQKTDEKLRT